MPANGGVEFTRRIPKGEKFERWEIERTTAKHKVLAIILSHDVLCVRVHWWGSRTVPHVAIGCKACEAGIAWVWKGYLAATDQELMKRWLVEVTPHAVDNLDRGFKELRTLRGRVIKLSRTNGKDNGPLHVELSKQPIPTANLPLAPVVEQALHRIWGVTWVPETPLLSQIEQPKLADGTAGA